jgi:hypothetical protein
MIGNGRRPRGSRLAVASKSAAAATHVDLRRTDVVVHKSAGRVRYILAYRAMAKL